VTSSIGVAGHAASSPQSQVSVDGNALTTISISLKLPTFSSPVDLNKVTVRLITNQSVNDSIFFPEQGSTVFWIMSNENPPDMLLEKGEQVELRFTDLDVPPSTRCTLEVMPPQGVSISVAVTTPP
jgi:archaellin